MDPIGRPRVFLVGRKHKHHLRDHGRCVPGRIVDVNPRLVVGLDGTSYLGLPTARIEYSVDGRTYSTISVPPKRVQPQDAVTVCYCPYHPEKITEVVWELLDPCPESYPW